MIQTPQLSTMASASSSLLSPSSSPPSSELPLKPIPGDYGLPLFGAVKDRLDYFYFQGEKSFFQTRINKYNSTVFRTNMPPGPFNAPNSKVVAVLDAVSFSVLFDTSKVEKRNVLDGTFFPSVSFTGGHRVCAYLDPSEPKHSVLKSLFLSVIAKKHNTVIHLFRTCLDELFTDIENQISTKNEANFNALNDSLNFNFFFRFFCNENPSNTGLGSNGSKSFDKWLFFQLAPLITLGLPKIFNFLEDFLLHTIPLPFSLVKSDYNKLYDAFYSFSGSILDEAEKMGIQRDEASHNLVFLAGFNAYGGAKTTFPALIKWVGLAGEGLHRQLADEIRTVVKSENGVISLSSLDQMVLTKSVVYEALRIEPPVPYQYGKAKVDMVINGHDASFEIKKGEMIFGYQPLATRDPRVWEKPEEFVGHRFVGEGEKMLNYVYWSNGRETDDPTAENKQCPGRDLVLLMCRIMLVELFLRYDTFTVEAGKLLLGSSVKIKALTKATS